MNFKFCFILILISFCSCNNEPTPILTIATAANMQFAIDEINQAFTAETNIPCQSILGSSGKLFAQIQHAAPLDVFVSADLKYPQELFEKGLSSAPQVYASGQLILWTFDDEITPNLQNLTDTQISHIAIPNPKLAPYGIAAVETLKSAGIYDEIKSKLVFGESISQSNQFIISRSAELGFTAKSSTMAPSLKSKGRFIDVDPNAHKMLKQSAVILKNRTVFKEEANLYYRFLFSSKAQSILKRFGYLEGE